MSVNELIPRVTVVVVLVFTVNTLRMDRRRRGNVPPKIREKYFSGNYYVKLGHFSGKNHVKFGNSVNFSEKYYKNSGILLIFRARIA